MTETLFALDKRNYQDCQTLFRGNHEQEYYQGDYWIEDAGTIDVRAERKPVGPAAVILLRSGTKLFFRRTRRHIRQDATDLSVLWFVRRGALVVSNQVGNRVAHAGDFAITRSTEPFFIECQPDETGAHEVLHVTVPTHILRDHVAFDFTTGLVMTLDRRELGIARDIFTRIFEDEALLVPDTARILLDTALTVVGHALRSDAAATRARQSVTDRRLDAVLRFIEVHLADPGLSTAMVSKGCGISPRYLSSLLRLKGTTFSELVWEQRLDKARTWLSGSNPREISISEIAYGVGFKSPAHFSRMFKRVFEVNPRDFRGTVCARAVEDDFRAYAESGGMLQ